MRKQTARIVPVLFISVLLGAASSLGAEAASAPPVQWRGFTIDGGIIGQGGTVGFDIGEEGRHIVSRLEYPAAGAVGELRGSYTFPFVRQMFSVRANVAHSLVISGTSEDTDYYPDGSTWNYSESDSEGTMQEWGFDAVCQYSFPCFFNSTASAGLFLGYGSVEYDYTDSDLVNQAPDYYTIGGENSTYDITFKGFRFGPIGRWQIIKNLSIEGEFAVIPFLSAEADGNWELRTLLFHQESDGIGLAGKVRVAYLFTPHVGVYVGLRGSWLNADTGGDEYGSEAGVPFSEPDYVRAMSSETFGVETGVRGMF